MPTAPLARVLAPVLALLLESVVAPGLAPVAAAPSRPPHARCATWQIREALAPSGFAPAAPRGALPCDGTPVGPPPNPQVGDSWSWYLWKLAGFPVAELKSCTVRGMGDHCYVVVEDAQWNVTMDQAKVDAIVDAFENGSIGPYPDQGIWELDTSHFGLPPDNLDQDPRVYFVYYDFDIAADGYFWGFDQECDDVAEFHSNECDAVYMNCSDFDPAGDYLLAVLAHEFEHLIHFNHDPDEAAWVDEGLGELAMWLYGNPDTISQFNTNPDRNLTSFGGNWYDYIKSYLFTLYFFERFGGLGSVKALVAEPLNGPNGYDSVLDDFSYAEDFADVFADWTVANFLDDPSIGDGRFGYVGETVPPFSPFVTVSAYPAGPNVGSVQHWAADYARFLPGAGIHVTFDGSDNNGFAVRALLRDDVHPTEVVEMPLDALQAGALGLPQLGTTHDEAVLVYASNRTAGTTTYAWGAGTGLVGAPVTALPAAALELRVRGSLTDAPVFAFTIPERLAGPARLELFDVSGRRAGTLWQGDAAAGAGEAAWRDAARAAPGIYFARLTAGGEAASVRVTRRR